VPLADHSYMSTVRVARIGKPHGIRGEVTVEVFTDSPESRFAVGNVLTLELPAGVDFEIERVTVEAARWNKSILLLKFMELSDRNAAEALRNAELHAPAEDPLDDREGWYASDLMGLAVHEGSYGGPKIGEVSNLITGAAQDLLEIRLPEGGEVLVPFVEDIVPEINEEKRVIIILPPPGLLELNQD